MPDFAEPIENLPEDDNVRGWLESQLTEKRSTLLAFSDDGVTWGRLIEGTLATGPNQPELREKTLQQAFLFGGEDEVRLFRDELGGWKACRIADGNDPERVIIESQILWGDQSKGEPQNGFVQVSEFRKGIPGQFLPVDRALGNEECVRLEVHHLAEYDKNSGEACIAISRLAGLSIGKRDMDVKARSTEVTK